MIVWLAAAACLHAGFQVTVSTLVYPALAEVGPGRLRAAHAAHSRRIAPLVAVLYGLCLLAAVLLLLESGPARLLGSALAGDTTAVLTAVGGLALAGAAAVTALGAAPLHGRLARAGPGITGSGLTGSGRASQGSGRPHDRPGSEDHGTLMRRLLVVDRVRTALALLAAAALVGAVAS